MSNVIQEYLASLGFKVDTNSFKTFSKYLEGAGKQTEGLDKAFGSLGKNLGSLGLGFTAFAGGIAAFTAGISGLGKGLGNITMGVDKFALSLYTSQKNARNLQMVMNTMGIESLEDLKYINLIPEQRKQFMELRSLANQLAPSDETKAGLAELRKLGFEFQKFQIEMSYIGLKLLGDFGNMMRAPLFRAIPKFIQAGIALLAFIANKVGAHLPSAGLGGITGAFTGGLAGRAGGAAVGEALGATIGSAFGPAGTVVGAGIGSVAGGTIGGAVGSAAGAGVGISLGTLIPEGIKHMQWGGFKPKKDPHGYKAYAIQQAMKYGVDPAVLMALINQESGWNPHARSSVGAVGIAQFMPGTAKGMGVDPNDPFSSIAGAARYLKNSLKTYGSYNYALASYNGGPGSVGYFKRHGGVFYNPHAPSYAWANQTGNYVRSITAQAARLRKERDEQVSQAKTSKQPIHMQVKIEVNGAGSPMKTAMAISDHLETLMNTRNMQGFA